MEWAWTLLPGALSAIRRSKEEGKRPFSRRRALVVLRDAAPYDIRRMDESDGRRHEKAERLYTIYAMNVHSTWQETISSIVTKCSMHLIFVDKYEIFVNL